MYALSLTVLVVGEQSRLEQACKAQYLREVINLEDYYDKSKRQQEDVQQLSELLNRPRDRVITLQDHKTVYVVMDKKDKIKGSRNFRLLSRFVADYKLELLLKQIGKGYVIYHYDHVP